MTWRNSVFFAIVALISLSVHAQHVVSMGSEGAVLSVGSEAGVRRGATGKLCSPELVSGRIVTNCSARFVIVSVSQKQSVAHITKGIEAEVHSGVLAQFDEKLSPPKHEPPKPPQKSRHEKERDEARAAMREANRAFQDGDYRGALERYENFVRAFPEDDKADEAKDRAAECRTKMAAVAPPPPAAAPPPPPPAPAVPNAVLQAEQLAATAETMYAAGQFGDARGAALQALKQDSTNPRAMSILTAIRMKTVLSRFDGPADVAPGPADECYVADTVNNTIRRISGNVVSTIAGAAGQYGNVDGRGTIARFNEPTGVAAGGDGSLYVADRYNATIRQLHADGSVTTIAGRAGLNGAADGVATAARFNAPRRLAVAADGTIFVADTGNHAIRRISPARVVDTVVTAEAADRFDPVGIAVDATGNIFFADPWGHVIRKVDLGGHLSTVAGVPGASGSRDGPSGTARFNAPEGVAVDAEGNIYVSDTGNDTIRRISNGTVTTIAGRAGLTGAIDGSGANARLSHPSGIACDSHGRLWIADNGNHVVRVMTNGFLETVAGLAGTAGAADGAN